MSIDRRQQRGETVLQLHGSFDAQDARELHEVLQAVDRDAHVTVDFREVRLFHDYAVAMLARDVSRAPNVALLGLSEHHHRLLRYLGIDPAAQPAH
jgi:anti-anti-sigma regulatory factor